MDPKLILTIDAVVVIVAFFVLVIRLRQPRTSATAWQRKNCIAQICFGLGIAFSLEHMETAGWIASGLGFATMAYWLVDELRSGKQRAARKDSA